MARTVTNPENDVEDTGPSDVLDRLFRAGRSFDRFLDEPVLPKKFEEIWDLMKMGPTSANQMPARMLWCVSSEAKKKLAELASAANAAKIVSAPVTVIIGMDMEFHELLPELFPGADAKSWFQNKAAREISAFRNSTLQGAYLLLAARAVGLDAGPMSGFDNEAVDRAFFADTPSVRSNFICALGCGERSSLPPANPKPPFARFNGIL